MSRWPNATGLSLLDRDVNVCDKSALLKCLNNHHPDGVLHLAAQSFVPESFRSPEKTFEVNFLGTLHLLEALAETGFKGRFLFVGTGDAYGVTPAESLPIREEYPLRPRNPYAVSKVAAEALCYQWSQTGPFEVTMARPFNHIGAGQPPSFAISDFARQIAEISAGLRPPVLRVGNIDVTRDFTDVNDVLLAYDLLLKHGKNGEAYNVCSGIERSIRYLIERLLVLSNVSAEILREPERFRPTEQERVIGCSEKLAKLTGWHPRVSMDETLLDLYRFWEKQLES